VRQRIILQAILGCLIALMVVACATAFHTNYDTDILAWIRAHQRTPLLWLIDFCALYSLLLTLALLNARQSGATQAEGLLRLRTEHHVQLDAMVTRAEELEDANEGYRERIDFLESEVDRFKERALEAMESAVQANARQLDAVNLALQYHRAELSQLRHGLRAIQPPAEPAQVAQIAHAERAGIAADPPAAAAEGTPTAPASDTGSAPAAEAARAEPYADAVVQETALPALKTEDQATKNGLRTAEMPDAEAETPLPDLTGNARSTLVLETLECNVPQPVEPPLAAYFAPGTEESLPGNGRAVVSGPEPPRPPDISAAAQKPAAHRPR